MLTERMQQDAARAFEAHWQGSYAPRLARAMARLGDHEVFLTGPSGYVLKCDGHCVGMDIQFQMPYAQALMAQASGTQKRWGVDLFSKLSALIFTHEHADHFDPGLLPLLAETAVQLYVPAFFHREKFQCFPAERIHWLEAGKTHPLGPLRLTAFESMHFQRDGRGVQEMGYLLETSRARLLFPCDIRDYRADKLPHMGPVDCLFAHVWLGRANALNLPCEPYLSDFCAFVQGLAPRRVMLGHLYETQRTAQDMWSYAHAGLVADGLARLAPGIRVSVPRLLEAQDLLSGEYPVP